ncbi:MAG TPA: DUF6785 family protein, partial [Armatimonadota bacterium]
MRRAGPEVSEAGSSARDAEARRSAVSVRAVLLGLALLPPTAWWLIQVEYIRYSDTPTIAALFFHCIAGLVALTAMNALVRLRWPKAALSP